MLQHCEVNMRRKMFSPKFTKLQSLVFLKNTEKVVFIE